MTAQILNITVDCADPRAPARFWAQVTGWPLSEDPYPGHPDCAVGATAVTDPARDPAG